MNFFESNPEAKLFFTFMNQRADPYDQHVISNSKKNKFLYIHNSSKPDPENSFVRICFHMEGSRNPIRLSFYYTNPQPVEKKLAKKCCSAKIEKHIMKYMDHLEKFEKKAVDSGNRELESFSKLGRRLMADENMVDLYKINFAEIILVLFCFVIEYLMFKRQFSQKTIS